MNQEAIQKEVEHKEEIKHPEEKREIVEQKERPEKKSEEIKINLTRLGKSNREILENLSFYITVISAIVFAIGIGIGSFIQGTVFLAVFGSFFIMIGIIIYIISQFM